MPLACILAAAAAALAAAAAAAALPAAALRLFTEPALLVMMKCNGSSARIQLSKKPLECRMCGNQKKNVL